MKNLAFIQKLLHIWLVIFFVFILTHYFYFQNYLISTILFFLILIVYVFHNILIKIVNKDKQLLFEFRKHKHELLIKEEELQTLFDNNHAYLWTIDLKNHTFIPSSGFENIFGYEKKDFLNNYELWLDRTFPEDYPIALNHYLQLQNGHASNQIWRFIHKNGSVRWIDAWGKPIFNSTNEVTQLTGVAYDITERKKLEEQLKYQVNHDFLTGLANRKKLYSSLNKRMKNRTTSFALFFIDIDRFKLINDNFGHGSGDQLLVDIANRIKMILSSTDLAARLGGDEFILVLEYKKGEKLEDIIQKVTDIFYNPFEFEKEKRNITASFGICLYPYHDESVEGLIRQADNAMYKAKQKGRNTYLIAPFKTESMKENDRTIEKDIQYALKKKQFHLFFQPNVHLKTKKVVGYEALIRWNHPEYGIINPHNFISHAEEQGLIYSIGTWVIQESFKLLAVEFSKNLHLSINVSPIQLANENFLIDVDVLLKKYAIDPTRVIFEITESFMENPTEAKKILSAIRDKNIQIAIDDFGTGYSSLSVLSYMPFDIVKIDRSFIKNMNENESTRQVIKNIILLAHALKARVIAEGIETIEQADFLLTNNCSYGQGYLYGKPLPVAKRENHTNCD